MSNLIIFYNLQNIWLLLLIDLDILTTILPKTDVPYPWIWLSPWIQPAGYHRSSRTICVFWPLYCLYQLLQRSILLQRQQNYEVWNDWYQKTPLLLVWKCINGLHNGFRTRTGGWEFWFLPWRWHILSIPLKAGRGTSAETCGDGVFPPDDLGSGPCTPLIIYITHTIAAFLLIKIYSF